jgi:hypothetical protein
VTALVELCDDVPLLRNLLSIDVDLASFVLHKTAHNPTESLMKVTTCTFGTHGAANFVRRFGESGPKKLDRDISSARTNRCARDH